MRHLLHSHQAEAQELVQFQPQVRASEDVFTPGSLGERRLLETLLKALETHQFQLLLRPYERGRGDEARQTVAGEQSAVYVAPHGGAVTGIVREDGLQCLFVLKAR